jgi:hypothetical protein
MKSGSDKVEVWPDGCVIARISCQQTQDEDEVTVNKNTGEQEGARAAQHQRIRDIARAGIGKIISLKLLSLELDRRLLLP